MAGDRSRPERSRVVQVRVPRWDRSSGHADEKFNRVAQARAIVGVAAQVRREDGAIAEEALAGADRTEDDVRAAG